MLNDETVRNPYDALRPTADPMMFFGRDEIFAFIRQRLVGGRRPQALALIGQRGMGKTSALLQVSHRVEARYLTAYIDLADVRFDEVGGLFAAMADAARQALEAAGISTYRLPPIPDDPNVDLWVWFSETYLDVTLSALRNNRRLVFLFDETSKLLDAIDRRDVPQDFDGAISKLLARDDRMDIIFAVDAEDEPRLENFGPLSDPLLHKRLGLLDDEASEALTRRPSAAYYSVQSDALEGILAMTGGHPFLLHVLNGLLWERAVERGLFNITLNDVTAVIRQATDESDPVLRLTWSRSTPNERQVLSAITSLTTANRGMPVPFEDMRLWLLRESDHPLDATALSAALRRLEYREVLKAPSKNNYTFTNGLQHHWLYLNGDAQPHAPVTAPTRPFPRRLAIPAVLLLVVAIGAALILGRIATAQPPQGGSDNPPTVTLDQDVLATKVLSEAQTRTAESTVTLTLTDTAESPATSTPVPLIPIAASGSPTSVLASLEALPSRPPSLTPRPSSTRLPTITESPSATDTSTTTSTPSVTSLPSATYTPIISITPPIFPTGQLRATSTFSP